MSVSEKQATWFKASYLTERAGDVASGSSVAEERFQQWIQVGDFTEDLLHLRLNREGLTLKEFRKIIGNREAPTVHCELPWISSLNAIIQEADLVSDLHIFAKNPEQEPGAFTSFYQPFIRYAQKNLEEAFQQWDGVDTTVMDVSAVTRSILQTLHRRLQTLSLKTLISEMHIAKMTGELQGDTPEARYQDFVERYLGDGRKVLEILEIYPVMGRLMAEAVERGVETHVEAIGRFLEDREAIRMRLGGDASRLIRVEAGAGDTHRKGRSVTIFSFESGTKLVYKPRSTAIDEHFCDLVSWINQKGFSHPLMAAPVLNRDTHGWQAFIEYRPCRSHEEVRRFYHRQGAYIALLYWLRSSDFHAENLVACGEHPVLIDLETLFSSHFETFQGDRSVHKAFEELNQSVFGSLMLPIQFSSDAMIDLDLSAIGGQRGQQSEKIKTWALDQVGTDAMRLIQVPAVSQGSNNRPTLNGEEVDAVDYTDAIETGFREMYHLLLTHREEWLSESGPIDRFRDDTVRHVLRPTHVYSRFLESSTHPDYLQDGLRRVQLFDYTWRIAAHIPKFTEVIAAECRDLLDHDVPYFTFRFGGTSLFDSRDNEIPGFYEKTCLEWVLERCHRMSPEDCEKQSRYIRISMATLVDDPWSVPRKAPASLPDDDSPVSRQTYLEEARTIGDELLQRALWSDDGREAYWISLNLGEKRLQVSPLGAGLYDGTLGITLFLAHLARETGEATYEKLSRASLAGALSMRNHETLGLSAFNGHAAVAYTLAHLGLLWDDAKLLQQADACLDAMETGVAADRHLDVMGGAAGAALVCLRLYALNNDARALKVAEQCGEHLWRVMEWEKEGKPAHPLLTGLSHGAAGFAWAWAELASTTGNERFFRAFQKALAYERSHFLPEENNWADLRDGKSARETGAFWCHGAPGIGLSRLMIDPSLRDSTLRDEWTIAVNKTLESGFGWGHSLCHGDFGNLDFLLLSARRTGNRDLEQQCLEIGARSVRQGVANGWRFGLHEQAELIGLMLGLAGIGYGLLRLWNPMIPSVLALELPQIQQGG